MGNECPQIQANAKNTMKKSANNSRTVWLLSDLVSAFWIYRLDMNIPIHLDELMMLTCFCHKETSERPADVALAMKWESPAVVVWTLISEGSSQVEAHSRQGFGQECSFHIVLRFGLAQNGRSKRCRPVREFLQRKYSPWCIASLLEQEMYMQVQTLGGHTDQYPSISSQWEGVDLQNKSRHVHYEKIWDEMQSFVII